MIKSMILDHCWVCGAMFAPKGSAQEEQHHIVPRAYGGSDGPVVSLCDTCHTRLHKAALCIEANKPVHTFITGLNQDQIQKLLYLSTCVVNAKLATKHDPNKRSMVVVQFTSKETEQLDALKKVLGAKSRMAVIKAAIFALYNKHFSK